MRARVAQKLLLVERNNISKKPEIVMHQDRLASHRRLVKALSFLNELDKELASARKTYGNPPDRFEPATFTSLVRIILGQQISRKVAVVFFQRLQTNGWLEADALAGLDYDDLQSIGLSRRKAEYIIDLARAETDGTLDLAQLNKQPAEIFSAKLTEFRGIGGWTISNYRLFCLADFDAWPGNDLALMEAVKRLKLLERRPTHAEMDKFARQWKPYRGAAALLLWHLYSCLVRDRSATS